MQSYLEGLNALLLTWAYVDTPIIVHAISEGTSKTVGLSLLARAFTSSVMNFSKITAQCNTRGNDNILE